MKLNFIPPPNYTVIIGNLSVPRHSLSFSFFSDLLNLYSLFQYVKSLLPFNTLNLIIISLMHFCYSLQSLIIFFFTFILYFLYTLVPYLPAPHLHYHPLFTLIMNNFLTFLPCIPLVLSPLSPLNLSLASIA